MVQYENEEEFRKWQASIAIQYGLIMDGKARSKTARKTAENGAVAREQFTRGLVESPVAGPKAQ